VSVCICGVRACDIARFVLRVCQCAESVCARACVLSLPRAWFLVSFVVAGSGSQMHSQLWLRACRVQAFCILCFGTSHNDGIRNVGTAPVTWFSKGLGARRRTTSPKEWRTRGRAMLLPGFCRPEGPGLPFTLAAARPARRSHQESYRVLIDSASTRLTVASWR